MNNKKCKCNGSEFGTYTSSIIHINPFTNTYVNIDRCIESEILNLWDKGIKTLESCCGHNKTFGYIAVEQRFNNVMEKMNYKRHPKASHVFLIKSLNE